MTNVTGSKLKTHKTKRVLPCHTSRHGCDILVLLHHLHHARQSTCAPARGQPNAFSSVGSSAASRSHRSAAPISPHRILGRAGPKNPFPPLSVTANPDAGADRPVSDAPKPITSVPFPSEDGAGQEPSPELAAIRSSLEAPYGVKPGAPWGYAIFRTVYGPGTDEPWKRILALLTDNIRTTCAFYTNAGDLARRHVLTPVEDAARLDGASSHVVRDAFAAWAAAEMQTWAAQPDLPDVFCGTRYTFCLYFDTVCLESLEHKNPQPVVKLLVKDWGPAEPDGDDDAVRPEYWEDGVTDEAEEDVGWMYIDVDGYVETYGMLDDPYWWYVIRVRAPDPSPMFLGPRRKGDP